MEFLKNWHLIEFVDIVLVAFLAFRLYRIMRGTIAINIVLGVTSVYLLYVFVEWSGFKYLSRIMEQIISVGTIALIVVFQPEIRKFLLFVGNSNIFKGKNLRNSILKFTSKDENESSSKLDVKILVDACRDLSKTKTGALIVIRRRASLEYQINSGDRIDALLSKAMLMSIFFKNSPLHDGAVIISENKIEAARCVLPVSENNDLPPEMGMRHRSALGITEVSDAICIIVSEETGKISIAKTGIIHSALSPIDLERRLDLEMRKAI